MPAAYKDAKHADCWRQPPEALDEIDASRNLRYSRRPTEGEPAARAPHPYTLKSPLVAGLAADAVTLTKNKLIPDRVEEMAWSLATEGQIEPGEAFKDAQGRTVLTVGFYRLAACKLIRENPERFNLLAPISFLFRPFKGTPAQAAARCLAENQARTGMTQVDQAFAAQRLEALGFERADITTRLKVTGPRVSQLLDLLRLPERVLDLIHLGKMGEAHARLLFGLEPGAIDAIAERIENGEKPAVVARELRQARRVTGKLVARSVSDLKGDLNARSDDPRVFAFLQYMKGDPTVSLDEVFPPARKGAA